MSDCAGAHETLTFVVRLWCETNANGHDRWRGRVEHVGTQEVGYVDDVAGIARFIERWTRLCESPSSPHPGENRGEGPATLRRDMP